MPRYTGQANNGMTVTPFGGGYSNNGGGYGGYSQQPTKIPNLPGQYTLQGAHQNAINGAFGAGVPMQQALYGQYQQYRQGQDQNALFGQGINERNMALQHKYDMETLNAQIAGQQNAAWQQMLALGINMPTNSQVDTARGRYSQSQENYGNLSKNGMYSDDQEGMLEANAGDHITRATTNMQDSSNNMAAQMGMAQNPNAIYYMGNAGQYEAAGARGDARMNIMKDEAMAKERGYAGEAGIAGQLSGLDVMPTKENAFLGIYGGPNGPGGGYGTGPDPNIPYGDDTRPPKNRRY